MKLTKKFLFYISQNYSFAVLRPIQKVILARGDQCCWFVEGDEVNLDYFEKKEVIIGDINKVISYSPDAVFAPGNVIPSFIPGLKVALFHGFNVGKMNRRGKLDHFNIRGCFDLYCTQGPNTTIEFQRLANKHGYFKVVETGWSAIDPLFVDLAINKINKPTILMCSTFSRHLTCAPHLYAEIQKLSQNEQWQWLIQFHPKMPVNIVSQYKALQNENLNFIETDNVLPLLQQADVMLCDTSSVLLMFILQNKPVVTFNNSAPGAHLLNFTQAEKLEENLNLALKKPESLMKNIADFIQQLHPYQDGKSSIRILNAVDDMFEGKDIPSRTKPFNFIRNFKLRKKLGYWKL